MPPAWKVRRGHLVIGLSVHLSVRLSVLTSVPLTNKVQYLKFGWWYSNRKWTVSSSIGSSHFTDIKCPWGGRGQNVFHKHMSSWPWLFLGIEKNADNCYKYTVHCIASAFSQFVIWGVFIIKVSGATARWPFTDSAVPSSLLLLLFLFLLFF